MIFFIFNFCVGWGAQKRGGEKTPMCNIAGTVYISCMYYNRISIFPEKFLKTVTVLDFQWRWEIYKAAVLWKSNFLLPVCTPCARDFEMVFLLTSRSIGRHPCCLCPSSFLSSLFPFSSS